VTLLLVVLLVVSLAVNAAASGSEIALYAVNPLRLRNEAHHSTWAAMLQRALTPASAFLATTLVVDNVADAVAVHFAIRLLEGFRVEDAAFWASVVLTPVVFVFGETLPKQWVAGDPLRRVLPLAPVLLAFRLLFLPVVLPLVAVVRVLEGRRGEASLRRQRLADLLEEGRRQPPGAARTMAAGLEVLATRRAGLTPFLRPAPPWAPTGGRVGRDPLPPSPEGAWLVALDEGGVGLLRAERALAARPGTPFRALAEPIPVFPRGLALAAALARMREAGVGIAFVGDPRAGRGGALLDLEYALGVLLAPATPEPAGDRRP